MCVCVYICVFVHVCVHVCLCMGVCMCVIVQSSSDFFQLGMGCLSEVAAELISTDTVAVMNVASQGRSSQVLANV